MDKCEAFKIIQEAGLRLEKVDDSKVEPESSHDSKVKRRKGTNDWDSLSKEERKFRRKFSARYDFLDAKKMYG